MEHLPFYIFLQALSYYFNFVFDQYFGNFCLIQRGALQIKNKVDGEILRCKNFLS